MELEADRSAALTALIEHVFISALLLNVILFAVEPLLLEYFVVGEFVRGLVAGLADRVDRQVAVVYGRAHVKGDTAQVRVVAVEVTERDSAFELVDHVIRVVLWKVIRRK